MHTTAFRTFLGIATILSIALLPSIGSAEIQGFLKIPGLDGESQAKAHEREIDLASYTQTVGTAACFKASVVKGLDKASPGLAVLAATNQVVTPVTVTLATPVKESFFAVLTVLLENVTVANLELVEIDGSPTPTERVTLRARRVTLTYRAQDPNGNDLPPITTVINCP